MGWINPDTGTQVRVSGSSSTGIGAPVRTVTGSRTGPTPPTPRNRRRRRSRRGGGGGGGSSGGGSTPDFGSGVQVDIPPLPTEPGGMPLDPYLEQGRRGLEDMLQASLAQINASRGMIDPQLQLQLARLRTNEGIDNRGLNEAMVGRGIYNSGVTTVNRNELTTQYDRQRQDMGAAAASQYGQLSNAEAQARLQYQQGLQELLLQVAAMQAQNPSLGLPYGAGGTSAGIGFDYSKYFNPLI